ncbi:MAG: MBL fold metallo-hydrolase [Anaerolineae bacterium]|nr:MBL fold metallo-hydrolase [Anaerolineae bacterium]
MFQNGGERSLVIDAGMGYCNLRAIVESLTDKPYDVVITHAHPDHAGMMHQFDKAYLNEKEKPSLAWAAKLDFGLDEFVRNNRLHIGNWEIATSRRT